MHLLSQHQQLIHPMHPLQPLRWIRASCCYSTLLLLTTPLLLLQPSGAAALPVLAALAFASRHTHIASYPP